MSSLRLKRGRIYLQMMSKVWTKLTKSTKVMHKFISHKSKKVLVITRSRRNNIVTPMYASSPRRSTNLKKYNLHKKCKYPPQTQSPIYIDNLFQTSHHPPSSSSLKVTVQTCDKIIKDDRYDENVHGHGSSVRSAMSGMGIDERAELFIARFRAELNKSSKKWSSLDL